MKTFKTIFTVALAAVTVGFASCSKENEGGINPDDKTNVRLVIVDGMAQPGSRSVGAPVTAQALKFTDGYVYFTNDAGDIYDAFKIVAGTPGEREVNMTADTKVFENITAAATKVHIIGNNPNATAAGNVNNIKASVTDIYDATGKGVAKVTLTGSATLVKSDATNYTATVSVQPLAARIQIAQFTGGANVNADYKIDGIFINHYYSEVTVPGVAKDDTKLVALTETDMAQFETLPSATYTAALNGITYDATGWTAAAKVARPSATEVWGYNVPAATGGVFPHIVIKLSALNTTSGITGVRYITITGFKDASTNADVAFTGGKIYKISDFQFDEEDLGDKPEIKKTKATVTVQFVNWTEQEVKPVQ